MRCLTVGIAQLGSTQDKCKNLEKVHRLVSQVKHADVVILPEYTMFYRKDMFSNIKILREVSETLDGYFVRKLAELCREYNIYIICGVVELSKNNLYNTIVVLNNRGDVVSVYRKTHLFDAYGYRESRTFAAGYRETEVFTVRNTKFGIAVCFELRFPEIFRVAALKGCEIVVVPAAWYRGDLKEEILHILARARAHENGIYVIVSNQYSEDFCGRSCVVDPFGTVLVDLSVGEKYMEVEIDVDRVYEARRIVPVLDLRKKFLYTKLLL